MRINTLLLASTAVLCLAAAPALAGPCGEQVAELEKSMMSSTSMQADREATGATLGQQTAAAPAVSATPTQVPPAGKTPGTEATSRMNQAVDNKATSAQDVRAQQQGQPTASQTAQGATAPGTATTGAAGSADASGGAYQTATGVLQRSGVGNEASKGPQVSSTPTQTPTAGQVPGTGATVAMNEATQNRATSGQDVIAQQKGQPTAGQIAQGTTGQAPQPMATGDKPNTELMNKAMAELKRAKEFDAQGKDSECMTAMLEAKRIFGQR